MKKIVPSRTSLPFTSKISDLELKFFLTLFSIFTSFLGILLIFLLVLSEFKRNIIKFYFPWSSLTMTNLDLLYIKNRIWRRSLNYWIFTQNNQKITCMSEMFSELQNFLNCYLAAPRPTLGHYRGNSLTYSMLTTAFYIYDPKVTNWEDFTTIILLKNRQKKYSWKTATGIIFKTLLEISLKKIVTNLNISKTGKNSIYIHIYKKIIISCFKSFYPFT